MSKIIILRGLPGSGKSHFFFNNCQGFQHIHASADNFPGLYSPDGGFDPSKLDEAHGACWRAAVEGIQAGESVVVDNTNLSAEELAPYLAIAQGYRVPCEVISFDVSPDVAYARQTHGVPREAFDHMAKAFEDFRPPFHWAFLEWLTLREFQG